MPKRWGFLCPDDGGVLLDHPDWGDQLWCPNNRHGGNGKFFAASEAQEGWEQRVAKPNVGTGLSDEQLRRLKQQSQSDQDAAAAESNVKKTRAAAAPKEARQCRCGCGETTGGGTFRPGHDARFHSRVKELEAQGLDHEKAESIASEGPLTGKYLDAQTARTEAAAKAKADAKAAKAAEAAKEPATA